MQPDILPVTMFVRLDGGNRTGFDFIVNSSHILLAEHFPGFPVAPGSQLLDFLWRQTSVDEEEAATGWVEMFDVRFQRPFIAGIRFSCTALDVLTAGAVRRRIRVTDPAKHICLQALVGRPASSPAVVPASLS